MASNKPFSRSVYMSSDGDGEVEVDNEDVVSDALSGVSVVESCQPCKEIDSKKTDARWKCTDCDKFVCDDCKKKHDIFSKDHTVTRIIVDTCASCLDENRIKEATWYCADCDKCMCDTCNAYHGKFLKNHDVTAVNIDNVGKDVKQWTASRQEEVVGGKLQKSQPPSTDNVNEKKSSKGEPSKRIKQADPTSSPNKTPLMTANAATQQPKTKKEVRQVSELSFKLLREKSVAAPGEKNRPNIYGSAFLPDGRLLLTDSDNRSLKLFSADLHFTDKMKLSMEPWDVAVYDTNEISVSFTKKKFVRACVDRGGKLKKICSVPTSHECRGIAYITKDQLAAITERALVIMTIDGKELQRVSTDTRDIQLFREPFFVAVDHERSRVYVSDNYHNTVTAINLTSHEVVYVYKLRCPYALAVDKDGYVYVCDCLSHNIHRITPGGDNARVFPVKIEVGLKTISFHPNTNEAIVAGYSSELALYCLEHQYQSQREYFV